MALRHLYGSVFCGVAISLACLCATAQKPGVVAGSVVCTDTHTPCRYAEIKLQSVESFAHAKIGDPFRMSHADYQKFQSHSYAVISGLDGSFQIEGVEPGDYYITAYLAGYLDASGLSYTQAQIGSALTLAELDKVLMRVAVSSGQTATANLSLARGASLGGVMRYDDGGAASNVNIYLYRKDASGDWKRYGDVLMFGQRMNAPKSTDDRGRFSIPGLPAGDYKLEANLPQPFMTDTGRFSGKVVGLSTDGPASLRIYNGDKFRLRDAPPIALKDGEERTDIGVEVRLSQLYTVQGNVSSVPNGYAITKGSVSLLDPEDGSTLREASFQSDGNFTFKLVANGNYLLQIHAEADSSGQPQRPYARLKMPLLVEGDVIGLAYTVAAQ